MTRSTRSEDAVPTSHGPRLRADARRSRAELLAAAAVLLLDDPAASIDAIAEAAGVGRTTAFRHFPTRELLVRATWLELAGTAAAELDELGVDELEPRAAVEAVVRASVGLAERYPLLTRGARPALDDPELVASFASADALLRRTIKRARRAGVLRDDIPVAVLLEVLLSVVQATLLAGLSGRRAQQAALTLALDGVGNSATGSR